jgi:hypothetical protein
MGARSQEADTAGRSRAQSMIEIYEGEVVRRHDSSSISLARRPSLEGCRTLALHRRLWSGAKRS